MLDFIQLLKQRYQAVLARLDNKNPHYFEYQRTIEQLLYAEAFLRKGELLAESPGFPLQIAVIGPTQAGKSSVVNLLLNADLAGVSPLAGYTVHAQGYCHGVSCSALSGLQHYFGRFEALPATALNRQRYDCYAVSESAAASELLPGCVIWDTPDFDSIDAIDYREGLIRAIALADLVVLVVSKEKYADQAVWEVMTTIAGFGQPTLVCLNKLAEGSEAVVLESFREKWRQYRSDPVPTVVPMLFHKTAGDTVWPSAYAAAVKQLAMHVKSKNYPHHRQHFFKQFWRSWLAPVQAEHAAQQRWNALVEQAIQQAAAAYRRDFLDHPHHYHTFQAALLNLLQLLEIPGVARLISKARRVMTWPARKLWTLRRESSTQSADQELAILQQIGRHLTIQLADRVYELSETETDNGIWWRENAIALRQQKDPVLSGYAQALSEYHRDFRLEIDAAAQRLYLKLQEQPLLLNGLRATRLSTDAGAMLLAIQAGGVGVHDFLLTPLILSVTSLLAESAVGSYMYGVEAELKQRQLQAVRRLFEESLGRPLLNLPSTIQTPGRFNISEHECLRAEQTLHEKKHGLRIL